MSDRALYIGLISGTSADGIDAALASFDPTPHLHAALTYPWPGDLRQRILSLAQEDSPITLDDLGRLDGRIGIEFAGAAAELMREAGVTTDQVHAIGSHGQTVRHRPDADPPFSMQIGNPAIIAERTGVCTVADFRSADIAAGGQGAPLVPAFHAALFGREETPRAILNLGGIANLTLLPGADDAVTGFDTGPANGLLDIWAAQHLDAEFDAEGALAARGKVDPALLEHMLADPYFARPAPKSTGREYFRMPWLQAHLGGRELAAEDVQATLVELTARSVAEALDRAGSVKEVLACGGGVHNPVLVRALKRTLAPRRLRSTVELGVDPDCVEAMAFAWLARQRMLKRPGNLPAVSGARGPRLLGAIYSPPS